MATTDPVWALQKALLAELDGLPFGEDSPARLLQVLDAVPQGTAYPYCVLSASQLVPDDPLARWRGNIFVYLTFWSRAHGQREVRWMMQAVRDAVKHRRFDLSAGRLVRVYVEREQTQREPDNLTFQGAMTLRCLVEF